MDDTEPRPQLTDEHLAKMLASPSLREGSFDHDLLADLRDSRAREAAQRTLREHAEHMKGELRAERDMLQQRIDKALADHIGDDHGWCVGCDKIDPHALVRIAKCPVRAALAGDAS